MSDTESLESPSPTPPSSGVRAVLHAFTGGGTYTAQFLRGLLWRHRLAAFATIALANVLGALVALDVMVFKLVVDAFEMAARSDAVDRLGASLDAMGWIAAPLRGLHESLSEPGFITALIVVLIGLRVLQPLIELGSKWIGVHMSMAAYRDIRRRMFRQFVRMRFGAMMRYRTGDLVQYLEEVTPTSSQVTHYAAFIGHVITVGFILATLVWGSWKLSLAVAVPLLVLVWPLRRLMISIRGEATKNVRASKKLNEHTLEFLGGLRQVHTYAREEYAVDVVDDEIDAAVQARRRGLYLRATTAPMQRVIGALAVGAVLYGGYIWFSESLGTVLMFVYALQRVLTRINGIGNTIALIQQKWPPSQRVASMLRRDDKEYVESGRRPFSGLERGLEFEDVTLRYDDGTVALDSVSFRVPRGRMVALVGPSGAGKSSIVNLLLRLYDPSSGRIVVDGVPVKEVKLNDWRGAIGLVDQGAFVFNASVAENIRFGDLDATDEQVRRAASAAHIADVIAGLPKGYETTIGERGARLSGGECQRLAIARALVREPSLLVLDEATSALDSELERVVQGAIESLRQGMTVIAIAHRLSTIQMADEIVVLDKGGVAESGSHDDLLARDGLYALLWRRQAGEAT